MKKRMWVGGLVLSLGGWASEAVAQDVLKLPPPPAPISLTGLELRPCPTVTLGRPVAITPGTVRREAASTGILPAAFQVPIAESPGYTPLPQTIALSKESLPAWPDDYETEAKQPQPVQLPDQPSGFAVDRTSVRTPHKETAPAVPVVVPAAPRVVKVVPGVVQTGHLAELLPPIVMAKKAPTVPTKKDAPVTVSKPPATTAPPPPTLLPEGFGPVSHDFWTPELDADPMRTHFYVAAEYLYWWTKPDHVPALLTTGDPNNVNPTGRFGFAGQPSTQTLFGDGNINGGGSSGVRITAGFWLDMFQEEGLEVSGFVLGRKSTHFDASSADFPVLARPFFNLNTGSEFSELVAFPGVSTGRASVDTASQLWGVEGNMKTNLCCSCDRRIDLFGGFRYLDLGESINIVEDINGLATAPAPFTNQRALVFDRFDVHNSFYGGQIGLDSEIRRGRWFLDVKGKLAVGVTDSKITIDGGQTFINPDGTRRQVQGGLLALSSNIGHYHKDHFSFVPEVGMNVGYQLNDNIRIFGGYNFLYWTGVMRPGDQIDRNLDVTRIPNFPVAGTPLGGQPQPAVPFKVSDYWAHGINVGIEFRY